MTPCDYPGGCPNEARYDVMGAHANDWAVNVCPEHREWAERVLAPSSTYPIHMGERAV